MEYLLTAQYAVESKQVNDDANIILHQTQGRRYRGQVLTAGMQCQEPASGIQEMIHRDDGIPVPKECFQRVMYDLAMIRQLGLPTWFLTLSAADMHWPDGIQNDV